MDAYLAMICQVITQAMERAGFVAALTVRVQFSVSPKGEVFGASVVTTSGNNDFDRAAMEAFKSMPDLGPPPDRKGGTYQANVVVNAK